MKKLLLMLMLLTPVLWADDTYTTNMGIIKPEEGSSDWGPKIRSAFDTIDSSAAVLNSTQTFTGGVTITSGTVDTLRSSQVLIGTPTYTISTDELAVSGNARFGGSSASVNICDQNFQNCSVLSASYVSVANSGSTSVSVRHDATATGGLQLFSGSSNGSYAINGSNAPNLFSADRLMIGPTFGDRIGNTVDASGTRSAIENDVYIGTHTVTGTPKLAVTGNTSSAYSILIGTSPALSTTDFHVGVSTSGALSLTPKTLAQLAAMVPTRLFEMYGCSNCTTDAVCVGTQTVTATWARISAKATACQ